MKVNLRPLLLVHKVSFWRISEYTLYLAEISYICNIFCGTIIFIPSESRMERYNILRNMYYMLPFPFQLTRYKIFQIIHYIVALIIIIPLSVLQLSKLRPLLGVKM